MRTLGVVTIGRNEGRRLVSCFKSLGPFASSSVYVDSGSTDQSVAIALSFGIKVVQLDTDRPFTAGRARNIGFQELLEINPDIEFIQFVDGDCHIVEGWLHFAINFLQSHSDVAIVCGRRKETRPEHSIYNRLCDIEWDTPVGQTDACGGDFMVRAKVFKEASGFNDNLIAGEEPEMCFRLRQSGWKVVRVDSLMTYHDADITRFSQWLKRSSRAGYAYAARGALHWRTGYCRRENLRIAFWAALLPVMSVAAAAICSTWFLLLLLAYPWQFLRLMNRARSARPDAPLAQYAAFIILGKWPEFYGQLVFLGRLFRGERQTLIEYK